MGRSSSRRSKSVVVAPAAAAPSRATRSAARLRDTRASEPPRPTIVSWPVIPWPSVSFLSVPLARRAAIRWSASHLAWAPPRRKLFQRGAEGFQALDIEIHQLLRRVPERFAQHLPGLDP